MPDADQIESILREWCDRRDRGDAADVHEILAEHPELAHELGPRIDALEALDAGLGAGLEEPRSLPTGPPEDIAGYRIIREIGRGGMGVVYEAEQAEMERRVALKLLAPVFTDSRQAVKRFQREAKAAGLLHHTNIVPIHTMGQHGEYWYYTMEYVEGGSLAEWIGALEPLRRRAANGHAHFLQVAGMFAGVADALGAAHRAGIIHRDVKPANLLLAPDDTLKIVDFGMARMDEAPSLTLSGEVLGTPVYMSPEQARARKIGVDHRTDIYSLGASLYEVLTRRPPFQGKSALDICSQIITRDPPALRKVNPRVPRDLAVIVTKAMEKERRDRYASAALLARDLRRFVDGVPIQARPVGLVGRGWRRAKRNKVRSSLIAAVFLLAAVAGFFAIRASDADARWRLAEYERLLALGQERIGFGRTDRVDFGLSEPVEAAHDVFTRAIELMPGRPEAWWMRALDPDRRSPEGARSDIANAQSCGLPAMIAEALRATTKAEQSGALIDREELRKRAAGFTANSPLSAYAKAQLLSRLGGHAEAVNLLGRAIDSASPSSLTSYMARRLRAAIRFGSGDLSGALEDQLAIRGRSDGRPSVEVTIGTLYRRLGNQSAAERAFERAMVRAGAGDSNHRWCSLIDLGIVYREYAFVDRASSNAVAQYPADTDILYERSRALNACRRPLEALEVCDRALELEPGNAGLTVLRASCFEHLGRDEDVVAQLDGRVGKLAIRDSWATSLLAMALMRLGRLDEALASLDRAEAMGRVPLTAASQRASILLKARRLPEALDATNLALRAENCSAESFNRHATVLHRMQKLPHAKRAFSCGRAAADRALARDPEDADALLQRGIALTYLGLEQEAAETLQRALESNRLPAAQRCNAQINLGRCYRNLGRRDEAVGATRSALKTSPGDADAAYFLASLLHRYGKLAEALAVVDKATCAGDDSAWMHNLHAEILLGMRKPRLAKAAFSRSLAAADKVISRDPENAVELFLKAFALQSMGQNSDAVGAYRLALDSERLTAEASYLIQRNLGLCLAKLGRGEKAVASMQSALKLRPGAIDTAMDLNLILRRCGRLDEALKVIESALHAHPESAALHNRRGVTLELLRQYEDAAAACKRACELDPTDIEMLQNYGRLLSWHMGRPKEAIRVLRRALALDADNVRTLNSCAMCLMQLGRLAGAEEVMRKVRGLGTWSLETCLNSADVSNRQKRYEPAVKYLDQAVLLAPRVLDVRLKRARILAIRLGRFADAEADLDKIASTSPPEASACYERLRLLLDMGRYRAVLTGVETFRKLGFDAALAADPRSSDPGIVANLHLLEVASDIGLGREQEARRLASAFLARHPDAKPGVALALLCATAGERKRALKVLDEITSNEEPRYIYRARVFAVLGDKEQALDNLERSIERWRHRKSAKLPPLPGFVKWKDDPRYLALAKKMQPTD